MTVLDEAAKLTSTDRNKTYGHPRENFHTTARLWDAYLDQRRKSHERSDEEYEFCVTPQDVALMMVLVKIARLANMPGHKDSLVDAAGYIRTAEMCEEE
jgi:hypothetical protein